MTTSIADIISPCRIRCDTSVGSKKRVLEVVSELIANTSTSLGAREVFHALFCRERLGSTGLAHGVALPHGRSAAINEAVGAFVKLKQGVQFDAPDDQPVDLVFGLLLPEESAEDHLQILAQLAERFGDDRLRQAIRACACPKKLCGLITDKNNES